MKRFLETDRSHGMGTNAAMLRRGFFSYRAGLYPFHKFDHHWFINDWAIETKFPKVNPRKVVELMSNKLSCHAFLQQLGLEHHAAPLIGMSKDNVFNPFSRFVHLADAFAQYGSLIVKPLSASGGNGVRLVRSQEEMPQKGEFLIEAALKQHPYAAKVFPGSVNTLRVMTLRPNPDEPPFIAGVSHRFGVSSSAPVDNFSRGGVCVNVDLESGSLSYAAGRPDKHQPPQYTHHPDTGVKFEDVTIPMWEDVKTLALELATRIPGLKMAGWDLCVTVDGPRMIEGNVRAPNPELFQCHRPLLLNPKIRKFFLEHDVISRRLCDRLSTLVPPQELVLSA